MFHFYDGYHFIGMHLLWWVFWLAFLSIVFGDVRTSSQKPRRTEWKTVTVQRG
jgi:hypothetical protein